MTTPDVHKLLPQSPEAEKGVLCAAMMFPGEVLALCRRNGLTGDQFHIPAHGEIYGHLEQAEANGQAHDFITLTESLRSRQRLENVGGAAYVSELFTYLPTAANVAAHVEIVREKHQLRQVIDLGTGIAARCYDQQDRAPELIAELTERVEAIAADKSASWESELDALRFNPDAEPPEDRAIYTLGDAVIATPGNLVGICAQAKAGKTALIGAIIASTLSPLGDTLGVESSNEAGGALIVFDTEQSALHLHLCMKRALYRAGRPAPDWLRSYRLSPKSVEDRRRFLPGELRRAVKAHGFIHSVILDGLGDLCHDPNDPAEAFALIQTLGEYADQYQTTILCVLHENPGTVTGKTRGHLGSHLERKAETNLRLEKDGDGVTVVYSERSRGAHIPKEKGSRFQWCDEAKMHVSCDTPRQQKETARSIEFRMLADEIFANVPVKNGLNWKDVVEGIKDVTKLTVDGSRKRLAAMLKAGAIKHSGERYYKGK